MDAHRAGRLVHRHRHHGQPPESQSQVHGGDTSSTKGRAFTASVEAGLPIALKPNLSLEPQAQIIYQNTRIDSVRDSASDVSFAPKNALIGRVGARLQGEYQAKGATWKPYVRADLEHTLGGRDKVDFSGGTTSTSAMGGTQARLGLGVSVKASERVSVYASAGYGFNLGGERRETVQGNLGCGSTGERRAGDGFSGHENTPRAHCARLPPEGRFSSWGGLAMKSPTMALVILHSGQRI